MLKVVALKLSGEISNEIGRYDDPIILDITDSKNKRLAEKYKRDYIWMRDFRNRGISQVRLAAPMAGMMKIRRVIEKAVFYNREIVVLYEKENHVKEVKRLIHDQRDSMCSVQGGIRQ
jgi:hypothetical protein